MSEISPYKIRRIGLPLLGVVFVGAVWVAATDVFALFGPTVLPSPTEVYNEFIRIHELILDHFWITLRAGLIGFVLAIALALGTGILLTLNQTIRDTLMPLLIGGNTIPRIAIAPLIIFYVDVTTFASTLIAAWVAYFPALINIIEGLESTKEAELDFLSMVGAKTWQEYRYLRLPNALPYIFDALKIGIITAMVGAIVGEFVASSEGLGYLALLGLQDSNVALALAIVFLLGISTTVFIYLLYLLEARLMFWKNTSIFSE
jgi:NitT/TauT family transport system permease protein